MRSRNIKIFTVAAVAVILIGQAVALLLIYSPDYFAKMALNLLLRPDRSVEKLLPEAGRPGADGLQPGDDASPDGDAPGRSSAEITANTFSIALQEQKSTLDSSSYTQYSRISDKYQAELTALQAEFDKKIDQLVSSAIREYRQNGQNNAASLMKMAQHYVSAGKTLEADCDSRFYNTISAMEMELKSYNLPTGVVEQTKSSYTILKNDRRQQLINKATAALRT